MPAAPTVIAQITDPHLRADQPQRAEQFAAAIEAVAISDVAVAAVLLTGDVADTGSPADYEPVPTALAQLDAPLVVIPGNHDDRPELRAALDLAGAADAPIRSVTQAGELRVIACDTLVAGETAGRLDVDWVAAQLAADSTTPTVLVMHHPPLQIASVELDPIALPAADRDALAALLHEAPNVINIIAGHVHRAVLGRLAGVPVIAASSSWQQLSFDPPGAPEWEWDEAAAPTVAFHVFLDGQLTTHIQPVPRVG